MREGNKKSREAWLERAQGSDLTPFYRDLSQSEILSEIKLP